MPEVESGTYALRVRCSTTELHRRVFLLYRVSALAVKGRFRLYCFLCRTFGLDQFSVSSQYGC